MSANRGLPLLSGPPPQTSATEPSCRKCNKEFNVLFSRSRKCNHCGYSYCHSCSDFQALSPRSDGSGYEAVPVCAYCIENLNITASGKGQLRGLTLAKLKKYAKDYGIDVSTVLEKDDLIDRLINARGPNRCLSPALERHYRMNSVPQRTTDRPRGIFSRAMDAVSSEFQAQTGPSSSQQPQNATRAQPPPQQRSRTTSHPSSFPRPDLEPDRYPQPSQPQAYNMNGQSGARPYQPYTPRGSPGNASARSAPSYAPPSGPPPRPSNLNVPPTSRPRSASAPRTPTGSARPSSPPRPLPSLDELLDLPASELQALPISTLKAILFRNHVNTGMVVEKSELVAKVRALIEDERTEREANARRAEEEDHELQEALERSRRSHEAREREREQAQEHVHHRHEGESVDGAAPPSASPPPEVRDRLSEKAQAMASHLERTGLCVICQDEEANIAIVDCGHLAMCRPCSDLIMSSTRECPLCRTRIVTEARLLRIFKA